MNRCAQMISDACTAELARLTATGVAVTSQKLTFNSSLKYSITYDPAISVEITSPTSFEVCEYAAGEVLPNGPAVAEARLSDFLLGAVRVRRQYEAVQKMKAEAIPAAWTIVSAYYCSYFACIEMCKLVDRTAMSFDGDDIYGLRSKAVGKDHAKFFESPLNNFVGVKKGGKISFTYVGAKPHQAAWQNAKASLIKIFAGKTWQDANTLIHLLSDEDFLPSRIRNTWNYKRSDFYGNLGESNGKEFRSLVGNHSGASAWINRRAGLLSPEDPCIVAVFCEILAPAINEASKRAGELLRQAQ